MKVISRYLGYFILVLWGLLSFDLALIALGLVRHFFGGWGVAVGLFALPATVPLALLYQGIAYGNWTNFIGLLFVVPLLGAIGFALVSWGRAMQVEDSLPGRNVLDDLNDQMEKELATPIEGDDDDTEENSREPKIERGTTHSAKAGPKQTNFSDATIAAARQRAKEIQSQIASPNVTGTNAK